MDNFNQTHIQPFWNTIELTDAQLHIENKKALALQSMIENVYKANKGVEITPYQIQHYLQTKLKKKVNINSVRRSITNLKNLDVLVKTENMRIGEEGKNEHYYRLKEKAKQPVQLEWIY